MFNTINMMNNFMFSEESAQNFFHNKTMLKNIKIWFAGIWMVSFKNINISTGTSYFSTSPSVTFLTKLHNATMATIGAIFNMDGTCRKKSLALRAFSFVVNLFPWFMFFVPYSRTRISPMRVILYVGDVIVESFHVLGIVSEFNADGEHILCV